MGKREVGLSWGDGVAQSALSFFLSLSEELWSCSLHRISVMPFARGAMRLLIGVLTRHAPASQKTLHKDTLASLVQIPDMLTSLAREKDMVPSAEILMTAIRVRRRLCLCELLL